MQKERKILPTIIDAAIFIIMEVAALGMVYNSASLQGTWLAGVFHGIRGGIWGLTEDLSYYFSLDDVNEDLAAENARLNEEVIRWRAAAENSEVAVPDSAGDNFRFIPAKVMKSSRNKQHNYIIINKGSEDGVLSRSGVISTKGVVGIVDAVSAHYSYALSFMSPEVSVSARLGRDGAVGPMVWDGESSSGAILKEIPLQYEYHPGDTVWTSGFSSIFPANIPLGITGKAHVVNGATNEIEVQLFQEFTAVRFVTVVSNVGLEEMENLEKSEAEKADKKK